MNKPEALQGKVLSLPDWLLSEKLNLFAGIIGVKTLMNVAECYNQTDYLDLIVQPKEPVLKDGAGWSSAHQEKFEAEYTAWKNWQSIFKINGEFYLNNDGYHTRLFFNPSDNHSSSIFIADVPEIPHLYQCIDKLLTKKIDIEWKQLAELEAIKKIIENDKIPPRPNRDDYPPQATLYYNRDLLEWKKEYAPKEMKQEKLDEDDLDIVSKFECKSSGELKVMNEQDWEELRRKYYRDCVMPSPDYKGFKVKLAPPDLFEWFKKNMK